MAGCRGVVAAALAASMLVASCAGGGSGEAAGSGGETPSPLVIGFLPLENPETLAPEAEAFAEHLSRELDLPVEAFVPTEYAPLVEALRAGRAHVAFMGSLATLLAHEVAGARPILGEIQRGKPYYRSQYYVRADDDIETLADLTGRSVAFTSPTGGSGFVFPLAMVVEEGLLEAGADPRGFFGEVVFAGGDEQVLKAVLRGDVDAGATSDYAPALFLEPSERDQLRVIGSTVVPPHSVVVSRDLPGELVDRIRSALLAMAEPGNIDVLKRIYGADGFVPLTLEDFEPVADAARAAGFDVEALLAP
jgi:phosphonate transport system substrate-binding protein